MSADFFQGYKGRSLEVLKKFNVRVWGQAELNTTRGEFKGTILPRSVNDDDEHIVMKVITGYNIGIDISYSGTVGATKQAQYFGIKSIALSGDNKGEKPISFKYNLISSLVFIVVRSRVFNKF